MLGKFVIFFLLITYTTWKESINLVAATRSFHVHNLFNSSCDWIKIYVVTIAEKCKWLVFQVFAEFSITFYRHWMYLNVREIYSIYDLVVSGKCFYFFFGLTNCTELKNFNISKLNLISEFEYFQINWSIDSTSYLS